MQTQIHFVDQFIEQNESCFQGCAYFGLLHDPVTKALFAMPGAGCHAGKRPVDVDETHQALHCLTAGHVDCPIFQQAQAIQAHGERVSWSRHALWKRLAAGVLIMLLALSALGGLAMYRATQPVLAQEAEQPVVVLPTAVPDQEEPAASAETGAFQPVTYSKEATNHP